MGSGKVVTPIYFRSVGEALDTDPRPASRWHFVIENLLRQLETPWPWDTTCTSIGVCPEMARCAQTSGFAIVCEGGLVRDAVEPALSIISHVSSGKSSIRQLKDGWAPQALAGAIGLAVLGLWAVTVCLQWVITIVAGEHSVRNRQGMVSDNGNDGEMQSSSDEESTPSMAFVALGSGLGRANTASDSENDTDLASLEKRLKLHEVPLQSLTVRVQQSTAPNLRRVAELAFNKGYELNFAFQAAAESPDVAQLCIISLFDVLPHDTGIEMKLLSELCVPDSKLSKPLKPTAEVYLWLCAAGFDWPKHPPLQVRHADGSKQLQIVEGSSTFRSLCKHFDPSKTLVPCTFGPVTPCDLATEFLFAAWKGQLDKVQLLLANGANPRQFLPRYRCTALGKADKLGYKTISDEMRRHGVNARAKSSNQS